MAKISLRKALQLKKNMVGEISKIRNIISAHNSQKTPNKHINVVALVSTFHSMTEKLVSLKTELAKANVPIYEDIANADELKGLISFYEGLDTEEEGKEIEGDKYVTVLYTVAIDYTMKDTKVKSLKAELEKTLEKIDEFNSTHFIEIAD